MTELNRAADRCDASTFLVIDGEKPASVSCGAQAYVKVENATGLDLLFCRHHFNAVEFPLAEQGFFAVIDDRHTIENANKLQGAHT